MDEILGLKWMLKMDENEKIYTLVVHDMYSFLSEEEIKKLMLK